MSISDTAQTGCRELNNPFVAEDFVVVKNTEAVTLAKLPCVSINAFRRAIIAACKRGARIAAICVLPDSGEKERDIMAALAFDRGGSIGLLRGKLPQDLKYSSLTVDLPQAQLFERELFEEHGIEPFGHPWLKPVRRHVDLEGSSSHHERKAPPHEFFRVEGEGIHEVAVGPVHAGVIEPGHFRFQCYGETVLSLEIQLGYQTRGAERLMLSAPHRRMAVAETIAGDTTIGHGSAYCRAVESLAGKEAPPFAEAVRAIALELERCANHSGDLGALCNDVGYLPGASWFGRLRGEFLNLSLDICGSRFGRGLLEPGGVRFGIDRTQVAGMRARLEKAFADLEMIADLSYETASIGSRFEQTGIVAHDLAEAIGLVGPAGRASGCDRDTRRDHPFGHYRKAPIEIALFQTGDVIGRARMRRFETENSIRYMLAVLGSWEEGRPYEKPGPLAPDSIVVSMAEGWRGECVHVAVTDAKGAIAAYKVVDPSFHNWFGLAMALRDNQISDFPLCNKSFNLSYAGHDL